MYPIFKHDEHVHEFKIELAIIVFEPMGAGQVVDR